MRFTSAAAVEDVVWTMKWMDLPRGDNRARINSLFNGDPPYTPEEQKQNNISTNVNFLEATKIGHDARRQFQNAFMSSDNFFKVNLDYGPAYKKYEWGQIITKEINRMMKGSRQYFEVMQSQMASLVLHGVGPCVWFDRQRWFPDMVGIEDVLVPSNTLRTMENLSHFAVYKQFTAAQLWNLTNGGKVDPAWNMDLVDRCIKWALDQPGQTFTNAELWSAEKQQERLKQDNGMYSNDTIPTIDCWDFYFFDSENKASGWNRKIILDTPNPSGAENTPTMDKSNWKTFAGTSNEYLFDSGKRKYGSKLDELVHFQFGDASAVAPFRYHSVRGIGFLLYAVCHLQNRLRCKFTDSQFEHLLQYFRVANPEDAERLTKVDLIDKGIIPEGLNFMPSADRWQVDGNLVQMGMQMNRQTMADNTSSFTQDFDLDNRKAEETATRTMAKVNASAALVGSMLNMAYTYQGFQYQEICRRFCIPNSRDPDVRKARVNILKRGVPEEAMNSACWDVQPTRVLGSGNEMLAQAMAEKLLGIRPMLDPEPQREVLHLYVSTTTKDSDLASRLVPIEQAGVSDARHDAQLAAGTLMQGLEVEVKTGMNHLDYVEALIKAAATKIHQIESTGSMATKEEVIGLNNILAHIGQHIQIISQDETQKQRVKVYQDDVAKLGNVVKGYAQRLQEQGIQGQGQPAPDPKDAAKAQAMVIQAQTKAKLNETAHAQKTAQRAVQFRMQQQQKAEQHRLQMASEANRVKVNATLEAMKAAQQLRHQEAKAKVEAKTKPKTTE
jgi:hypothetical protein